MSMIKTIFTKYKDVIPYLFFGVCTTLVNVAAYWIASHLLKIDTMVSTVIAWILAVLFAYVTNRKWVFHSTASGRSAIIKEMVAFFLARLATGVVDWLCMFVFVEVLSWNDVIIKTGANILVIILNYIASKLLIFKHSDV